MGGYKLLIILLIEIVLSQDIDPESHINIAPEYLNTNKANEVANEDHFLPGPVFPISYNVKLIPDLNNKSFVGNVGIKVATAIRTKTITMHAYDITIKQNGIKIQQLNSSDHVIKDIPVLNYQILTDSRQFLIIETNNTYLDVGQIYLITIDYDGKLNDELDGFYYSSYTNKDGNLVKLAVTQFEPCGARRAMPSFDEPKYKSQFTITISHDANHTVLSNMPVDKSSPNETSFDTSVSMPTYLVAFTVTDFSSVASQNNDNKTFKDWSRPEFVTFANYSNELSPKFIDIMEDYTAILYPISKMDQIALPDFAAGAMENWGLVTYREEYMLYSPTKSSTNAKWGVASIVAHELAHQWFGNLVTCKWWSHIWLNEGFATYYSYYIVDKNEPTWEYMDNFVTADLYAAFSADAQSTAHPILYEVYTPSQVNSVFDTIAYSKGGSIIRMMVNFMGADNFQAGIKQYLNDMSYSNADKDDLWRNLADHIPAANLPSGKDFASVMDTWVVQAGYPLINVTRKYSTGNNTAFISQHRYVENSNATFNELYTVPLTVITPFTNLSAPINILWLDSKNATILNLPDQTAWILVNYKQQGYYRVNYDISNWRLLTEELRKEINTTHTTKLDPNNRAQIMNDALTLARNKAVDYTTALDTTNYLNNERKYIPWSAALTSMSYIHDRLTYNPSDRGPFQWYMLSILNNTYDSVNNFTISPTDTDVTKRLRTLIVGWTCKEEQIPCLTETKEQFQEWTVVANPDENNPIAPDLKPVVYCGGMSQGGKNESEFLLKRYENARYPQEISNLIQALGCAKDTTLLQSLLNESIKEDSKIRKQNARSVLSAVYNNYWGVDIALDFLLTNYNRCKEVYGGFGAMNSAFAGISRKLNTQQHKDKLVKFRSDNLENLGTDVTAVDGAINTLDEILMWHKDHKQTVVSYFMKKMPPNSAFTIMSSSILTFVSVFFVLYNSIL